MTRTTNARLAGSMFLLYIAVGITAMMVSPGTLGDDVAAKLTHIAEHAPRVRIAMMLGFITSFIAILLGIGLYGITRDADHELAVFALACRFGEGVVVVIPTLATLGLLSLAAAPQTPGANALVDYLMVVKQWNAVMAATFFAVGSTVFCWLLLRGRIIPTALAWLGVIASVLLVMALPLRLAGVLSGIIYVLIWIPMAAFEIPLGFWLLIKGAKAPATLPQAPTVC